MRPLPAAYTRLVIMRRLFLAAVAASLSTASATTPAPALADRIVVHKAKREMLLLRDGIILKSYKIALGTAPVGPKQRQGDHKTPEGLFTIDSRNPHSKYHKGLHISYPGAAHRERARRSGYDPGGAIMIHGLPNGWGFIGKAHRLRDWTDGCVAVTDQEIDEIWNLVPNGTPVEITP